MFTCTSNVRQRLTNLAKAYAELIQSGAIVACEETPVSEQAIALSKDAFRKPIPLYHFPPSAQFPAHCFHLDLMTVDSLEAAVATRDAQRLHEYFKPRTGTAENALFSFLCHSSLEEFSTLSSFPKLWDLFAACSRLNDGTMGAYFVQLARALVTKMNQEPVAEIAVFHTKVPTSVVLGRTVSWLLLATSVCNNLERRAVLQSIVDLTSHNTEVQEAVKNLCSVMDEVTFGSLVDEFQMYLTVELMDPSGNTGTLDCVAYVLSGLFAANFSAKPREGIIPHTKFYNGFTDEFNEEAIKEDFIRLHQGQFSFCKYPFLINARFKSIVLLLEESVERDGAFRQAVINNLFTNRGNEVLNDYFIVLSIDRRNLVSSTLRELRRKNNQLRRPLRIQFVGEEGVDEGGLKKEFFQLLLKELLHPNYNMFTVADGSRSLWFVPSIQNSSNMMEFFLIGQILGLAVYNNIILDVAFPTSVFRKLLNVPLTLQDLQDVDPSLHSGLKDLLTFEESEGASIEDIFCRQFVYEHDVFGAKVDVPIVPGGENVALTGANRQLFVDAVAKYILESSIAENFTEFKNGFLSVCNRPMFAALRPEELEQLVCGNRTLDFDELKEYTRYEGFDDESGAVVIFWQVLKEFDDEHKKKFLRFCTGSDRVPVGGLRDLNFVVGKNGDDSDLLPTAHTCFNHLLLPAYHTVEKMREKLLLAIENCEGFYGGK